MKRLWYWIKRLKSDVLILYFAVKDPRVPRQAKLLTLLLAAYILSPVDIIPDLVIPGLGYVDDIVLIPLAAELIQRMIPEAVVSDFNSGAVQLKRKATSWVTTVLVLAGIILALWLASRFLDVGL